MSDLFGNHIVGFPTRLLIVSYNACTVQISSEIIQGFISNNSFGSLKMAYKKALTYGIKFYHFCLKSFIVIIHFSGIDFDK